MPRKLEDLDVAEISLVDNAANRKKFYIIKRRKEMEEFVKLLKSFMGEDDEEFKLSEEDIAKAGKLDEKAIKAIQGALNILNKYKDVYPADVLKAIKTLTKYASYGYSYPAAKSEDIIEELTDVEKAGRKLSKATIEQLRKALEIIESLIKEKEEDVTKGEKLPPEVVKKLEKLAKLEKAEKERIEKEKEQKEKEREELIKQLKERVEKLEKMKGIKKSIDSQDDDDKDKDKRVKWPSLVSQED